MSTAEVASTFFEDFAFRRISDHLDNQEKFALLCSKFERDIATIQRQIACYQFEQRLHKTYRQN
jgi:oligoendopeptidase F